MSEDETERTQVRNSPKRVFVAAPFKSSIDPSTGVLRHSERRLIHQLTDLLEGVGYCVCNSHRREAWGAAMLSPEACTKIDLEEIRTCDALIAFPGSPASPGTHIEIGWAAALCKPIVLGLDASATYAFLIQGLYAVAKVEYVMMEALDMAPDLVFAAAVRALQGSV